jgi:alpha-maltose-1-phosphate synthase
MKEYEEADYILLPSEFVKRSFMAKGFAENKLLKVPYGFNPMPGSKITHANTNDDFFTVLYVGTISIRKGIRYLIEAFQSLKHTKKRLVLVGPDIKDGALKGIQLSDDIVFKGILKGTELEEVYRSANVFCLPSIEDGFGLVLGEALSFGLPIITTCNTGADDIITDGQEGFVVSIRNSKQIAEKLQQLIDDPFLLESMSENSLEKSKSLNGWEECGKKLVETLYKINVVNGKQFRHG